MNDLSAADLGKRLRLARERVGLTQAQAACLIEVARTTMGAIESGKRRLRMDELRRLAKAYGESVNALVRFATAGNDMLPRLRKAAGDSSSSAVSQAAEALSNLVCAEVELENVLGVARVRSYPPKGPSGRATCVPRRSRTLRICDVGWASGRHRSGTL